MTLRLNGSTSGYTEIDAPAVAGNNTLVLPTGNGSSGQVLTTNGSGALSWSFGIAPGIVMFFASGNLPSGWLKANGDVISRTTYANLFAVIGTTYGVGDGSTTFKLPDLRGEFIRGWDDGRGVDAGRVIGSAQAGDVGSHTHTINLYNAAGGAYQAQQQGSNAFTGTTNTGATGGTETRPRNIALMAIIKF
jgi:microcystin-dependent protein